MSKKENQWKYPKAIVTCEWLKERIFDENIRVFDCTTYLHYTDDHPTKPYDVESGYDEYRKEHIIGAAFLDLQGQLSSNDSQYNFTLPDYHNLGQNLKKLGIGDPFHIVLYSKNGTQWATRIWWMIFVLGYKNVSILDGGLQEWKRLAYPIEEKKNIKGPAEFKVNINSKVFIDKNKTMDAIEDNTCYLLNALTRDLHSGENPRYGRPGRIPNSKNIPFHKLLDKETGKLISPNKARNLFLEQGISPDLKVINYCGGGIAATLNAFVLRQLGIENLEIYDNSMSEWAMDHSLPIETG